ncbi:MAG: hypothetical protein HQL81_04635 [Magnetococcales bacterium]|nr:hypothetical protein [Magnetococcales bacterium]
MQRKNQPTSVKINHQLHWMVDFYRMKKNGLDIYPATIFNGGCENEHVAA